VRSHEARLTDFRYESINTVQKPHAKVAGQLGGTSLSSLPPTTNQDQNPYLTSHPANLKSTTDISAIPDPAHSSIDDDDIQGLAGSVGAKDKSGVGNGGDEVGAKERREQGYGGERDMRRDVGA